MAKYKEIRENELSLEEWETITPLLKRLSRINMWWTFSVLWVWVITCLIIILANTWQMVAAILFLLQLFIVLLMYFSNNKKGLRLIHLLKEFSGVTKINELKRGYKCLIRLLKLIFSLDITMVLWPLTFPLKIIFWIIYKDFRRRALRIRKLITRGEMVLVPEEEEIKADPFYSFLQREGLYNEETEEEITDEGETTIEVDEEKLDV